MNQDELDYRTRHIRKPSKRRQAQDRILVVEALRVHKRAAYSDAINPHETGTLRHERFQRWYIRERQSSLDYEPVFQHICDVYGFDPGPKNEAPTYPGDKKCPTCGQLVGNYGHFMLHGAPQCPTT